MHVRQMPWSKLVELFSDNQLKIANAKKVVARVQKRVAVLRKHRPR